MVAFCDWFDDTLRESAASSEVRLEKVAAACEAIVGSRYECNDAVLDATADGVCRSLIALQ